MTSTEQKADHDKSVKDWKSQNKKHKKVDEGERYKDKGPGEYDESEDGYGDTYEYSDKEIARKVRTRDNSD